MQKSDASRGNKCCMQQNYKMASKKLLKVLITFLIVTMMRKRPRMHKNRKQWVREWIKTCEMYGAYHHLMKELRILDTSSYRNFVRMSSSNFEELLSMVAPLISRKDTNMCQAIPR